MLTYPKIETLYNRDPVTHRVFEGQLRLPEFALISRWLVTEKIEGTNIRVHLRPDGTVRYGGRTEDSQLQATLVDWLRHNLGDQQVAGAFEKGVEALVFGEGYGDRVQKHGGHYREGVAVRLFDVAIIGSEENAGRVWWLSWDNVVDVAAKLNVGTVPLLASDATLGEATAFVRGASATAALDGGKGREQEGIVARTDPLLLTRGGDRVAWKLKGKDFGNV